MLKPLRDRLSFSGFIYGRMKGNRMAETRWRLSGRVKTTVNKRVTTGLQCENLGIPLMGATCPFH